MKPSCIVLVTGDRRWTEVWLMWTVLEGIRASYPYLHLYVGDAKGADECAWGWAKANRVPRRRFKARWETEGRAAGPKRNVRMFDAAKAAAQEHDVALFVFAFHNNLAKSKGTKHMVGYANSKGDAAHLVGKVWP